MVSVVDCIIDPRYVCPYESKLQEDGSLYCKDCFVLNRTFYVTVPKSVYTDLALIAKSRRITVSDLVSSFVDRELRIYKELNPAGADNNK